MTIEMYAGMLAGILAVVIVAGAGMVAAHRRTPATGRVKVAGGFAPVLLIALAVVPSHFIKMSLGGYGGGAGLDALMNGLVGLLIGAALLAAARVLRGKGSAQH